MRLFKQLSGSVLAAALVLSGCDAPVQPPVEPAEDETGLAVQTATEFAARGLDLPKPPTREEVTTPLMSASASASNGLTFFTDRATFDAAFPGLPLEDFEAGNVISVVGCTAPIDENTNNNCFSPGDIEPGIRFNSIPVRPNVGIALIGTGIFGNTSKYIINNFGGDDFSIEFTAGDVSAVGMDVKSLFTETCLVDIKGASGSLGSTTVPCSGVGNDFLGVQSSELITQIVVSATFAGVDNIAFGPGNIPFAEFVIEEADLELDDDDDGPADEFDVEGHFELGAGSNGIDPLTEDVTVVFGTFAHTIAAGLFVRDDDDEGFEFDGTLPDGSRLKVDIDDDGEFEVEGEDLDLSGNDPDGSVFFSLKIGNDIGETTIEFDDGEFELDDDDDN